MKAMRGTLITSGCAAMVLWGCASSNSSAGGGGGGGGGADSGSNDAGGNPVLDATLDGTPVTPADGSGPDTSSPDATGAPDSATPTFSVGGSLTGVLTFTAMGTVPNAVFLPDSGAPDAAIFDGGYAAIPSTLTGLVLQDTLTNETLPVTVNGGFTFDTPVATGQTYNVIVSQQPSAQWCTVTNGSQAMGSAPVTNISVSCVPVVSCAQLLSVNPAATTGYALVYPTIASGGGDAGALTDASTGLTGPIPVYCHMGSNPYSGDTTSAPNAGWTLVFNENFVYAPSVTTSTAQWNIVNPAYPSIGLGQYSILGLMWAMKSQAFYELYEMWPYISASYISGSVHCQQLQNPLSLTSTATPATLVGTTVQIPPNQQATTAFVGFSSSDSANALVCGQTNGNYFWGLGLTTPWPSAGNGLPTFEQYTPDGGSATTAPGNGPGAVPQGQLWLK